MVEYEEIRYSVKDRIATITLDNPKKANALSVLLRSEMVDALKRAERDDDVSVILLEGAGDGFSSGYDLVGYGSPRGGWVSRKNYDDWTDQFARSCIRDFLTIWDLLKPVVAKVHGYCLAGASELISTCDIIFAADDARIGHPAMRAMTTPDLPWFAWRMPMAQAKYHQLTGISVSGKDAVTHGVVTKSFPASELDERVAAELRALTSIEPDMLAGNKLSVNHAYEVMGYKTYLNTAPMMHALTMRLRPNRGGFGEKMREGGLKAAVAWRDGPFKQEGLG